MKTLTCLYTDEMILIPGTKTPLTKEFKIGILKIDKEIYEAVEGGYEPEVFLRFLKKDGTPTKTTYLVKLNKSWMTFAGEFTTAQEEKDRIVTATEKNRKEKEIYNVIRGKDKEFIENIRENFAEGIELTKERHGLTVKEIEDLRVFETILLIDSNINKNKKNIKEFIDLEERELISLLMKIIAGDYTSIDEIVSEGVESVLKELSLTKTEEKTFNKLKREFYKERQDIVEEQELKAIRKKIDEKLDGDDEGQDEENLRDKIKNFKGPIEIQKDLFKELKKARRVNSGPEYANIVNYIETILSVPFESKEEKEIDLTQVKKTLDSHHYGLEEIKERIVEILAVQKLSKKLPVLCLAGPPGTGKTSIAKSIATAMGREFVKVSLGGVNGESEVRGHRKTYVGAMPGVIIKNLIKAGCNNPLMLLDEIDKLGKGGYNGDPSSALLELLDPSQNTNFKDHFIEHELDLSKVMFIATANYVNEIPKPLLDRMELIELKMYTVEEKIEIVKQHLIKEALENTGLEKLNFKISDKTIELIIEGYTLEAGVRELQRQFARIANKLAVRFLTKEFKTFTVTAKNLADFLGKHKFREELKDTTAKKIGSVNGLAWTAVGGCTLDVQAITLKTSGATGLSTTGNLKAVMKESTEVAFNYLKTQFDETDLKGRTFHLHFPAGATPKDGPSAGITIATALYSAMTEKTVRQDIAMTGEISIFGEVLPIGGVKEKVSGAFKQGIKEIILPEQNRLNAEEISKEIKEQIKIHFVRNFDEVRQIVFGE